MRKKGIFAVFLSICVFLFSCSPKPLTLTEDDNGKEFTVKKGASIVVRLRSNPTTGFDWHIRELPTNLDVVSANVFISSTKDKNIVGAGGTTEFTFKAVKEGEGTLVLIYKRNWEGETSESDIFKVKINVQ